MEDPKLYDAFLAATRHAGGENHLAVDTGRFTLCIEGDTNTYSLFAETAVQIRQRRGWVAIIVPSGIAADHTNRAYFQAIVDGRILRSVYDFENRERELFPEVYYRMRFCLLTLGPPVGDEEPYEPDFVFFAQRVSDLANPDLHFTLTPADVRLLNPETRTCPIFRSRREAEIIKGIYRRVPVLGEASDQEHWRLTIRQGLFHQTNDADLLYDRARMEDRNAAELARFAPVYEGRMIGMYDHRASSVGFSDKNTFRSGTIVEITDAERNNPELSAGPRFWATTKDAEERIPRDYKKQWFLAFKDVSSATNERTLIATVIPRTAVLYTIRVVFPMHADAAQSCCLLADWNSICTDFVCRSNTSGNHVSEYIIRQVPVHGPLMYSTPCPWDTANTLKGWISRRVLELAYTAWDLSPFATDLTCYHSPFRWDVDRRFFLRCELDAAFFHLYCLDRDSTEYVLDAFRIVRERDEARHGDYRTKQIILDIYDAMTNAKRTGIPYQTRLDPPPADPRVAHPMRGD